MAVSMWARSTNTPFDWWLVLICCERKIHWLQRTKLQALLFRAVSLLGFCYNIVYLHYIYMVLAQFVLKFSSFPSGLRKVVFLSNPLMTAVMIMVTPSLESGKQSYLTRLRFSFG